MLCPSVWEFKPKKSLFHDEKGDIVRFINNPSNIINRHYYNHLVSITIPECTDIPETITHLLAGADYYRVENFDLSIAVKTDFIHSFIKRGQLTALSIDNHLDTDDCAAITATGTLLLLLNKETFQSLGLEGKPYSRHRHRFCVQIDLKTESLTTEKKTFQRLQWCLKNNIKKFTMLFAWKPPEVDTPISLAAYLIASGCPVALCRPKVITRRDYNVTVPLLCDMDGSGDKDCEFAELTEWLGVYSLGGDLETGSPSNYLTTYECPIPNHLYGHVCFLKGTGFFTHDTVLSTLNELRKFVLNRKNIPWVSLYVQCFSDVPMNGDKTCESNSYTIFLLPTGTYHMMAHSNPFAGNS